MALFSKKTKETKKTAVAAPAAPALSEKKAQPTIGKHASAILLAPRITEKGAYLGQDGVYVFNVGEKANKREIGQAIHAIFNVWPRKVRIARIPRKQVVTRGTNRVGMTRGGKKAYVYLKKGDTIEVV